jgi:hypothetical protein
MLDEFTGGSSPRGGAHCQPRGPPSASQRSRYSEKSRARNLSFRWWSNASSVAKYSTGTMITGSRNSGRIDATHGVMSLLAPTNMARAPHKTRPPKRLLGRRSSDQTNSRVPLHRGNDESPRIQIHASTSSWPCASPSACGSVDNLAVHRESH